MAVFPKTLLATEGSEAAKRATQTAVHLTNQTSSELHVVSVYEVPVMAGACAAQGVPVPASEHDQEVLEEQVKQIEEAGGAWLRVI